MDAAVTAERVLRDHGVEAIRRQRVVPLQQLEGVRRDDQMQEALLRAHRAVAVDGVRQVPGDAKPYPPAVTASLVRLRFLGRGGRFHGLPLPPGNLRRKALS